jgi:hypothetical protein
MLKVYNTVKSTLSRAEAALATRIKDGSLRSGFTFRDIARKQWRDLRNPDVIHEAIRTLEDAHWIRPTPEPPVTSPMRGRPKAPSWDVNPALS